MVLEGDGGILLCQKIIPDGCATVFIVLDGEINFSIYKNGKMKRNLCPSSSNEILCETYASDNSYFIDIQLNLSVFFFINFLTLLWEILKDTMYTFRRFIK